MQLIISKDFESLSEKATHAITEIMANQQNPLICVASGDSPSGIYKNIVDQVQKNELTMGRLKWIR
jgi:6-phosphogluconolactonase/glucosamine-6-phosphate isomerase/deaminase